MSGSEPAGRRGAPPRRLATRRSARRTRLVATFAVLVPVLVVAAGVALAGPTVADVVRDRSVRLVTPATAGGLTRGADPKVLRSLAGISGEYDTNVQAYYEDGERPVVIWGGTTTIWLLDAETDGFFAELERQGYTVEGRERRPTGAVGGRLECARTTDAERDEYGVCIWLNHGGLLAFLSPRRLSAESTGDQVTRMLPDLVTVG